MPSYQIPPPVNHIDFEKLIVDLLNESQSTQSYKALGKNGQRQKGIDIISLEKKTAVQCKHKDLSRKSIAIKRELLNDIEETVKTIVQEKPAFEVETLFIATTFSEHPDFDEYCASLKDELRFQFNIAFWGWETIQDHLVKTPKTFFFHYPLFTAIPILTIPKIDCSIDYDEHNPQLVVINNDPEAFSIDQVAFLKVNIHGYEDILQKTVVRAPFVTFSRMRRDFEDMRTITINRDTAHACAFICSYDEKMVSAYKDRVFNMRGPNERYSALPSLQSVKYLVLIWCKNQYKEPKQLAFMTRHIHGSGYDQIAVEPKDLLEAMKAYEIPKFPELEPLWEYMRNNFAVSADQAYGVGPYKWG